jgi:hypothetical protein
MVDVTEMEDVKDLGKWLKENPHQELGVVQHLLALTLAGTNSHRGLCTKLGLELTKENLSAVKSIVNKGSFEGMAHQGRQDMVATALDYVRGNLMRYCLAADEIAIHGVEERNRLAALKDLMDRGGTASALKVSMSTPTEYSKLMKEMLADPAKESK